MRKPMAYRIELTKRAARELELLPKPVQKRVARWLDILAMDPRCEGSRQLAGEDSLRRVNADRDCVIVYTIFGDAIVVLVVRIANRREAYRNL